MGRFKLLLAHLSCECTQRLSEDELGFELIYQEDFNNGLLSAPEKGLAISFHYICNA